MFSQSIVYHVNTWWYLVKHTLFCLRCCLRRRARRCRRCRTSWRGRGGLGWLLRRGSGFLRASSIRYNHDVKFRQDHADVPLTKNNPRVKVGDAQGWSNVTAWTIGWRRWKQWNWWAWEGTRAQGARPSSPQLPKSRFVFIFQSSFNNSSCIILQMYVLFCNYRGLRHLCWSSMTAAESRLSKIFLSLFCPNEPLFIEKQWPSTPPAHPHLPTPFKDPLFGFLQSLLGFHQLKQYSK